jgi:hypothetical protein
LSVEQNLNAVNTLKSIGVMFQYGFMLFDPSSTFNSVRENLDFLRTITRDGDLAATFCRMLPYDGTAVKDQLALEADFAAMYESGLRFSGDPRSTDFSARLPRPSNMVGWIHGVRSLSPKLDWAWHEVAVTDECSRT